jgi:hypothetical protein
MITGWKIDRQRYIARPTLSDGTTGPDLFEQFVVDVRKMKISRTASESTWQRAIAAAEEIGRRLTDAKGRVAHGAARAAWPRS